MWLYRHSRFFFEKNKNAWQCQMLCKSEEAILVLIVRNVISFPTPPPVATKFPRKLKLSTDLPGRHKERVHAQDAASCGEVPSSLDVKSTSHRDIPNAKQSNKCWTACDLSLNKPITPEPIYWDKFNIAVCKNIQTILLWQDWKERETKNSFFVLHKRWWQMAKVDHQP